MVNIYDGNNVLMRSLNKIGHGSMSLRQHYAKMAIAKPGEHIWVFDGRGHNDRRKAIYPPYKANRTPTAENIFAHIQLFKRLLALTNATTITVPSYEADDVAGTLAMKLAEADVGVTIHTNDMDYAQLQHPLIHLNGVNAKGIEPEFIPLYKALVGDPSDNITGIPGFGAKTWAAILYRTPVILAEFKRGNFEVLLSPEIGLPNRITNWLRDAVNLDRVRQMFAITQFITVPDSEISTGVTAGTPNPATAEAILKEYFL